VNSLGLKIARTFAPDSFAVDLALRAFMTPPRPPRPDNERLLLATGFPMTLDAAGHRIPAWSWGSNDAPTTLLVHGWGGRGAQLGALVPELLERGQRVVTYDAPGHGDNDEGRATLVMFAETLRGVAARLGRVDAVVAHSFGAAATTVALARGLAVERVAYIAPVFSIVDSVARFLAFTGLSAPGRERFRRLVSESNMAGPEELDGAALAPHLRVPLLVVHDREDREVPYADGAAAVAAWPGARIVTTSGLGHRRLLDDPDVVGVVRDFVLGQPSLLPTVLDEAARVDRDMWDREARRARAFP
jgi:pimeloyl-ACP methyl ester carboxylesterase